MKKPTVLVTRKLPDAVEARACRDYDARLNLADTPYGQAQLLAHAEGVDAILSCHSERFDASTLEQLPKPVKIIASFSVGFDNVDIAAAKKAGIIVTNTPGVLSDATAEIVILLMLGAARRASEGERLVRDAAWKNRSQIDMLGTQVTGKRIGIAGMGRVGQIVARRARGFDMEVHYHNRNRLEPALEQGAHYHKRFEDLLAVSDVLSLNCPATPQTINMLNEAAIAALPDGAIIVNASRGALIDEDALIAGLAAGKPAAAGLDVFNNEPDIDPRFKELANTFLLPHTGSATVETRDAMGFRALDNLDAFFAGKEPGDRVA